MRGKTIPVAITAVGNSASSSVQAFRFYREHPDQTGPHYGPMTADAVWRDDGYRRLRHDRRSHDDDRGGTLRASFVAPTITPGLGKGGDRDGIVPTRAILSVCQRLDGRGPGFHRKAAHRHDDPRYAAQR